MRRKTTVQLLCLSRQDKSGEGLVRDEGKISAKDGQNRVAIFPTITRGRTRVKRNLVKSQGTPTFDPRAGGQPAAWQGGTSSAETIRAAGCWGNLERKYWEIE